MAFLHERLTKLLNREDKNLFKAEVLDETADALKNDSTNANQNSENLDQNALKLKFDKDFYIKQCDDDVMNSKFRMYGLIDDFFKKEEGKLHIILNLFQSKKFEDIPKKMEALLETIQ